MPETITHFHLLHKGAQLSLKMALRLTARAFRRCHRPQQAYAQNYSESGTTTDNADGDYADIVISGGGMVGGSMACALGK